MSKSFSVAMNLGEKGRANYDRIFRKAKPWPTSLGAAASAAVLKKKRTKKKAAK